MLGLDIGSRAIYLVRYAAGQVLAFGQCPTPPESVVEGVVTAPQRVSEAIRQLMRLMRLPESGVSIVVGGSQVINKWVEVPRLSLEELNRSAPLDAPRHLPPTREPMLYRFWLPPNLSQSEFSSPSSSPEKKNFQGDTIPARLIAISEAAVHSRLDAALLAGLEPVGVVPEADALVRVLTRHHRPQSLLWRGRATAILALRHDYTEMSVARETYLEFTRTLRLGLNDAIEMVQRTLGASFEEAESLLKQSRIDENGTLHFPDSLGLPTLSLLGFLHNLTAEMRRMIDFQRSRFPEGSYLGLLDSFLLTGEGAAMSGLAPYCSQSVGLTCLMGDLTTTLKWRVEVGDRRPEFFSLGGSDPSGGRYLEKKILPEEMGCYASALGAAVEMEVEAQLSPQSDRSDMSDLSDLSALSKQEVHVA
jgi:type IV pilus assembly protein PilM